MGTRSFTDDNHFLVNYNNYKMKDKKGNEELILKIKNKEFD